MKKFLNSKKIKILLLILFGVALLFEAPHDPDFGWHYKYGEYFFQNGKILKENIFSYTYPNYEWVSSYWIPQILIYASYHFLGSTLPTIFTSLVFSIFLYFLLQKKSKDLFSISSVFILSILFLRSFVITVRPMYLSTVFFLLLVNILREKNNNKIFIPLIFLIWANTHADFLLGLFILGIYCLSNFLIATSAPTIDIKKTMYLFKNKGHLSLCFKSFIKYLNQLFKSRDTIPMILKNFWVLFISIAVTLVNPYGFKLWAVLLNELNQPFRAFVMEWLPPHNINFLSIVSSTYISMGLIFSILPYKECKEDNGWNRFIIIVFYILSIKSVYFLRVVVIVSFYVILKNIELVKKDLLPILKNKLNKIPAFTSTLFLIFLSTSALLIFTNNFFLSLNLKKWAVKNKYPYGAVSYIKKNPVEGNMLNDYSWGGYLIWQLPEYKTFIDGRMTAWRDNTGYLMEDYRKIVYTPDKNVGLLDDYLEKYDIKWVLNRPDSALVKYLKENRPDEWKVIFEDEVSTILKKN